MTIVSIGRSSLHLRPLCIQSKNNIPLPEEDNEQRHYSPKQLRTLRINNEAAGDRGRLRRQSYSMATRGTVVEAPGGTLALITYHRHYGPSLLLFYAH